MADINHVIVTGRLTSDAQAKDFEKATAFSGSIAVNHFNKKEGKEEADFFNFKLWGNSPKQIEYYKSMLVKGTPVVLEGSLGQEKWEKDGQKQSRVVINAITVSSMGGKKGGNGSNDSFPEDDLSNGFPM